MARPGPRSIRKYSDELKLTAVHLGQQPGIQVRTAAASSVESVANVFSKGCGFCDRVQPSAAPLTAFRNAEPGHERSDCQAGALTS